MYISKDGVAIAFQGKLFQYLILKKKLVSYIELLQVVLIASWAPLGKMWLHFFYTKC